MRRSQSNFVRHRGTEWCAGGSAITERVVVMFQHLADGWSIRTCQARPGIWRRGLTVPKSSRFRPPSTFSRVLSSFRALT